MSTIDKPTDIIKFIGNESEANLEINAVPDVILYVAARLVENFIDQTSMDLDLVLNQIARDVKSLSQGIKISQVQCNFEKLLSHLFIEDEDIDKRAKNGENN